MVHRFVPRCQIGPGSNPASVVCGWWFCLWVCRAVGPGPLLLAVPGPAVWCVLGGVLLSRTLAGAVPSALSGLASGFGMECRAFPCRCDHRDDCTGSAWAVVCCCGEGYSIVWLPGLPAAFSQAPTVRVWLVVGLGVDRIVDALRMLYRSPPAFSRTLGVWWWGCCCLCWPISTSQLSQPLPVFHSWPINPVVCWGPTKSTKGALVETLS